MAQFYIEHNAKGYVVARLEVGSCPSVRYIRNFGDRQGDAMRFRDDCNSGKIDDKRVKQLADTYTPQPYKYLGRGRLAKDREEQTKEE